MDDVEPEIVHEIPHPDRNDNWLVRCHPPQGASIEMVKMRMRDEDKIDLGQMMNFEPGLFQALNYLQPF